MAKRKKPEEVVKEPSSQNYEPGEQRGLSADDQPHLIVNRDRTTGQTTYFLQLKFTRTRSPPKTIEEWLRQDYPVPRDYSKPLEKSSENVLVLLSTWAWVLDILLEMNVEQWSAVAHGLRGNYPKPWFRGSELNVAYIANLIALEIEEEELEERTIRKHVEAALTAIRSQWADKKYIPSNRVASAMYLSLYALAKATIKSWFEKGNGISFDTESPQAVVMFFSKKFGRPEALSEAQAIACLNHCWG